MNRREFIAFAGAVAAEKPSMVLAQTAGTKRIGVLVGNSEGDPEAILRKIR